MINNICRWVSVAVLSVGQCGLWLTAEESALPTNVIIIVGDGMGLEHVKAGGLYIYGQQGTLRFESTDFFRSTMTTYNATGGITDSAASGTAMATGYKVNNSVISTHIPGTGEPLETILEIYRKKGRRTGLVTTANPLDATPASFGAHEPSRNNSANIRVDYLSGTRPEIICGAATPALTQTHALQAGYRMVFDRDSLIALHENETFVIGAFKQDRTATGLMEWAFRRSTSTPSLAEMAQTALRVLAPSPNGFFLVIENEHIDEAGHRNDLQTLERTRRLVTEVEELHQAVSHIMEWAGHRTDTLVVTLSDHETGGLKVLDSGPLPAGSLPSTTWATGSHTNASVGVYAWGFGAKNVKYVQDNTDIFRFLAGLCPPVMVKHPVSVRVAEKSSASFSVLAEGSEPLRYGWQKNGVDIPAANSPTLIIPSVVKEDNGALIRCRIINAATEVFSSEATLTVVPNISPVAYAGDDQQVPAGALVALDGIRSSDPDGDAVSFSWTQVNGTPVVFHHIFHSSITFTAPRQSEPVVLTFQLTVQDARGATATDEVNVHVSSDTETPRQDPPPDSNPIGAEIVLNPGQVKLKGGPDGVIRSHPFDTAILFVNANESGDLTWSIYDRTGKKVRVIIQTLPAHTVSSIEWNGTDDQGNKLPAGVYWCHVSGAGVRWKGKIAIVD